MTNTLKESAIDQMLKCDDRTVVQSIVSLKF